jgi:hypothetical protein
MSTSTQLVTGLGGAIGCDLRQAQNQLVFVEYSGNLSRLNLFRSGTVVSAGTAIIKGTFQFDLDTGVEGVGATADIWWDQKTAVLRSMAPQNGATLVNLGTAGFSAISPNTLASLGYSTTPIDGNNDATNLLVADDVFAVHTSSGNYAKVRVLSYGYDLQIEWVTYQLDSPYAVLGTGYTQPEDVKASVDGAHVYVTERTGDLVKVALTTPDRSAATVVCSGMTAPQQMFLDEAHDAAYVVEYALSGNLWKIDLGTGAKTAILAGLQNAVGLVLSDDLQYAYISEQTTGPAGGRVSQFQLSTAAQVDLATNLTAPFFLTWLDASQTSLLVADRDPANEITAISVASATSNVVASGLPVRPSSVAVLAPGQILVCCDQAIEEIELSNGLQPAAPLLMAVGFIPVDSVAAGLANTTTDPTYFYQVDNTPFGGTLPLMVNHLRADNEGAKYYRVKVDGVAHTDSWTDEKWNGSDYVAQINAPISIGSENGYYRVRPLSELFLWLNPSLGDLLDTTGLSGGTHKIVLEIANAAGTPISASPPLEILVDNNSSIATLGPPEVHNETADSVCGVLHYGTKNADLVNMPFTASHPNGFATFSFQLNKGVNAVDLPATHPTSGPVSAAVSPITATIQQLMGACETAGFAEYLYVATMANNGWSRQSQYDASAMIGFVLTP